MKMRRSFLAAGSLLGILSMTDAALAQKAGGVVRIPQRDMPASASIHEEATYSTQIPFMGVYNNLVIYDQHIPQNSLDTIVPELAESWSWSEDRMRLTFKLRQGVRWHDGKPFTANDVQCTWEMLQEKREDMKLRKNPRQSWSTLR